MTTKLSDETNSHPALPESTRHFSKARPLATSCDLHPKTLFRWADAGLIHRYKVNQRLVLFDTNEVLAFIAAARVG